MSLGDLIRSRSVNGMWVLGDRDQVGTKVLQIVSRITGKKIDELHENQKWYFDVF